MGSPPDISSARRTVLGTRKSRCRISFVSDWRPSSEGRVADGGSRSRELRLGALVRATHKAERRLRLRRALHAGTTQLAIALTGIAAVLTATKLGWGSAVHGALGGF